MVPLSEVVTLDRKGVHPSEVSPETPYIGLEHIERGGRILPHPQVGDIDLKSSKFYFFPGHILYGKLRPNLGKISRPDFAGICSTDILPLRPHAELDRGYLAHYLSQPEMIRYATSRTTGVNLPRLSPSSLAKFPIPLPPLGEQRRIAAILDQADAIRAKRRQEVNLLSVLPQTIYQKMFGGFKDSTEIAHLPLKEVISAIDSGKSPICEPRPSVGPEPGILKVSAVTTGTFSEAENKAFLGDFSLIADHQVCPGDVLMTRKNTRNLVGAVAVVPQIHSKLFLPDLIFRLHLDKDRVSALYFQTMMMSPEIRYKVQSLAGGSAGSMPNISKGRLRDLVVPIPPVQAQHEYASKIAHVSEQRKRVERALDRDDELFASLQSRAFRGEL